MAKIVLNCLDVIGQRMAGPAVRYWEFAKELAKEHEVILKTKNKPSIDAVGFTFMQGDSIPNDTDIVITQEISHTLALHARRNKIKIILDAYDPQPLEYLEIFKECDMAIRNHRQNQIINTLNFSFQMADAVICANSKQKDLYTGVLMALKRITPKKYDENNSMQHLIDLVPFGLSSTPPIKTGEGLRQQFKLNKNDKVILWGGGIWNWFDPLTLIESVAELSKTRTDIKLVFMGLKHPNESVPEMKMANDALALAKKLNLLDVNIFFNFGWIPYTQRQNFLMEADIGVSTHFEHLETQYAFRTRMLDYIWAGLPIIATEGDSFADLVHREQLGIIVPPRDIKTLANAIKMIVDNPVLARSMKDNHDKIRAQFYWEDVVKPIHRLTKELLKETHSSFSFKHIKNIASYYLTNKSPFALLKRAVLKLALTIRT